MFRTRPPVYALACVLVWLLLLLTQVAVFFLPPSPMTSGVRGALYLASLGCILVMGFLLLAQLPRALRWRPRRSIRPSPEVQFERQRIARDLHDQVGSQLVNAMALLNGSDAEQRPARQALEQCMLDVRLLVDSMDGYDDSLADCLARLRHRVQPVLERRGIRLIWSIQWDESMPSGPVARELTNVAREAICNVLQHTQASELEVSLSLEQENAVGTWLLSISDNGGGLPQGVPLSEGMGMTSMRGRVQSAGGTLLVSRSASGGVQLRIAVPA